jgi:hypothetical protein
MKMPSLPMAALAGLSISARMAASSTRGSTWDDKYKYSRSAGGWGLGAGGGGADFHRNPSSFKWKVGRNCHAGAGRSPGPLS